MRLVPLPMYRQPERSPRSFLHTGKKSVRDSRKTQNKNVVDEMAHTCWFTYCSRDLSATLEMTTTRSVIKTLRRLDPSTQFSYFQISHFLTYDVFLRSGWRNALHHPWTLNPVPINLNPEPLIFYLFSKIEYTCKRYRPFWYTIILHTYYKYLLLYYSTRAMYNERNSISDLL